MTRSCSLVLIGVMLLTAPPATAQQSDDGFAWINNCKALAMAKGADDETAHGYCACLDHEMGDDEINDIAGWEKSHPGKVAACKAAAEWK